MPSTDTKHSIHVDAQTYAQPMRLFLASSTCCEERMALRSFLTLLAMEERGEALVLALGLVLLEADAVVVFSVALAVAMMSVALVGEIDDAKVSLAVSSLLLVPLVASSFLLVPFSSKDTSALLLPRLTEAKLASSTPVGESALIRSTLSWIVAGLLGVAA